MASDADTDELPSVDEQLLQAINILTLCGKLVETSLEPEQFDMSYPLMAVAGLLEAAAPDDEEIIQAKSIVLAVAGTLVNNEGGVGAGGFDPSYPLDVAIDLIDAVIHGRPKKGKKRSKKAMREIAEVDPDHARQFHRLLNAAGKLPMAELERLARYAEIALTDAKPKRAGANGARKAPEPNEPPAAAGSPN